MLVNLVRTAAGVAVLFYYIRDMKYQSHFGFLDELFFKLNSTEPFCVFRYSVGVKHVTAIHVRKFRCRYPKWMKMGGMYQSAHYRYTTDRQQIAYYKIHWCEN